MEISCIVIDDEPHAVAELTHLIKLIPGIRMVDSFDSVQGALGYLSEHEAVDVIFSDIEMPTLNGISAAKILRGYCNYLIYVTAYRNFAFEAFGVNANGYLLKPVSENALIDQVTEIREGLKNKRNHPAKNIAFIKGGSKNAFIKVDWNNVIYVQALLNYVNIYTVKGNEVTYAGLKFLEEFLKEQDHFMRISKSIIVNMNYLDKVDGNVVKLANNSTFTIGDKYRNAFHEFLRKHTLNL